LTIGDDQGLLTGATSLTRAITKTTGEASITALAADITRSAAEFDGSLVLHTRDAVFTALVDAGHVLGGDSGHEGSDSEDELHGDGWVVLRVVRVCCWGKGKMLVEN